MVDVLIVEDDQVTAMELEAMLKERGHRSLAIVSSGEEAIAKVDELEPELLLVDIRLEGEMSGIEAVEKIQETHDIPVIYVTAHSDQDTLREAQSTKPEGYLVKPISDEELDVSIEMVMRE